MRNFFSTLACFGAFLITLPLYAQITIQNGNVVPLDTILQKLVGDGVEISNLKILTGGVVNTTTNAKNMYGLYSMSNFNNTTSTGLVMSTGKVADINNFQGVFASTDMSFGSDPYLTQSVDAVAIEFDIKPTAPIMYFNYIFASEEYPEYVCSQFNDAFKFLVSGPNPNDINAPYTYANTNIAIIPGTGVPGTQNPGINVSINTVFSLSSGQNTLCSGVTSSYPQYYSSNINNQVVFDGYTSGLYTKLAVIPLETYKLRLVIADRADRIFDSGVFIQKMNTNIPVFNADILQSAKLNKNELLENTETANFKIKRPWISEGTAETFTIETAGSATPNVDYELYEGNTLLNFPLTVSFSPTQLEKIYTLKIKADGITENTEDILLQIKNATGIVQNNISYKILGANTLFQNLNTTLNRCEASQSIEFEAPLADSYAWDAPVGSYTCVTGDCRKISINPSLQPITIIAKLGFGSVSANDSGISQSITVQPNYMELVGNTPLCAGSAIKLLATGRDSYTWSPSVGLSCTDCPNPIANPTTTTTYTLTGVNTTCGSLSKVFTVEVVAGAPAISFVGLADIYCINDATITLNATPTGGSFLVNGQTTTTFSPSALGAGKHTVFYQKQEATCLNNLSKSVDVIIGLINIITQPTNQYIDLNSSTTFSVQATGNTALAYQWQEKVGANFVNITNIAPYTGANTPQLSIANVSMALNGHEYRCVIKGCETVTNTHTVTLDVNPLSLPSQLLDTQVKLSPNPTKDKIWIQTPQNATLEVEVLTLEGKKMKSIRTQRIDDQHYIFSIAEFAKGTYLVKVWVGKEYILKRIIKE